MSTTPLPILVVGSVDTLAAAMQQGRAGEQGSNLRFEQWKAERAAVHNYADHRAVLDVRGLRAVHECGGLYVIVRECPHAPDNIEVIAENLTAEHARQICEAVNGRNGE